MQRSIKRWAECSPEVMAKMSQNAIIFAFKDAKSDIAELSKILEDIAFPKRGSKEENMSLQDFAQLIQNKINFD